MKTNILKKVMLPLLLGTALLLSACGAPSASGGTDGPDNTPPPSADPPVQEEEVTVSRICTTEEGKPYLEVDAKPFLYTGVQIRIDWLVDHQKESVDELEYYFAKAEELGVKVVELPIQWKDIELSEGAYSFRNLSKVLTMAKNHNLKVELLLFSVNIGGSTRCVPDYVKKDKEKYPQYRNTLNRDDALFFVQNDPDLLEKEGLMVSALMESVYNWSKVNGSNTVISVQVRNEPDLYITRDMNEYELTKADGERLTREEAIKETIDAIRYISTVIKSSRYKVITRINVCNYYGDQALDFQLWDEFLKLDSIDMVGEDTYRSGIVKNKNVLLDMARAVKKYNSYPQIAENCGAYENNDSLLLMSQAVGASYCLYDLITPQVITDEWKYYDWGILNNRTKEGKPAFYNVKNLLAVVNKAGPLFQITDSKDIAAFNLVTNSKQTHAAQEIKTSKTTYRFATDSAALAYAINSGDFIYMAATDAATIEITNNTLGSTYEEGYFDGNGAFVPTLVRARNSNTISLQKGVFYRVSVLSAVRQVSDTLDNIYGEV